MSLNVVKISPNHKHFFIQWNLDNPTSLEKQVACKITKVIRLWQFYRIVLDDGHLLECGQIIENIGYRR